jgi:hypothetical protein
MNRFAETLIKMIDDGNDIFDVAKYFGGIEGMLKLSEKYPYLQSIIKTKLGGVLYCGVPNEDEIMIPFELPFIITELQVLDEEMPDHYDATVNVIIPELTESREKQILLSWLFDYLTDMGSEVGSFNDSKLNMKQIWIHVDQINGQIFQLLGGGVSDKEVLEVIPNNYIND